MWECHPTHHGPSKPKECWPGPGDPFSGPGRGVLAPSSPEGCPFTPTLHPYPPSTQSRNLGSCQKNTHFILFFIFLIKGLHIIVCLTKTKVLVSEFENYFPRINGKGSLINIFLKKTKAKLVPKASFFPVSFVTSLPGAKAGLHTHPYPHSPFSLFLGASFTGPQSLLGLRAWQP